MRTAQLLSPLIALSFGVALAGAPTQGPTAAQSQAVEELWVDPVDLEQRDLYRGPAIGPPAPQPKASFALIKEDNSGKSPGYDVRDANGVEWSVKLGPEAQSEVVASRILWAIGFHQPPTYYLIDWTLTGATEGAGAQQSGRFRPELPTHKVVGDWKWDEHPLARTRQMAGLLVAQMVINNWDLKSSNNKIYEVSGAASGPRRWYVTRDLGASLGENEQSKWTRWLGIRAAQGSKNDVDGFEKSGFIDKVENGRVKFSYSGPNKPLLAHVTPEDVRWTAQLLSRISDQQWQDAFRAGGYAQAESARFIAKIKEKIAQGQEIR